MRTLSRDAVRPALPFQKSSAPAVVQSLLPSTPAPRSGLAGP